MYVLYSGKFSHGANFRSFRGYIATANIKTMKISMGGENDDIIVNDRCANAPRG